jgi:RND superfamily putative drug exporter
MSRAAAFALKRPGGVALGSAALLVLLALPFLGVTVHGTDARVLPADSESRQVYEEVQKTFRQGRPEPVTMIVERDATGAEMRDYLNKLNQLDGVALMQPRVDMPATVTVIDLIPDSESVAQEVVRAARAVPAPVSGVLVGGIAAEALDYQESVLGSLPIVLAVLFAVMLALLFVLTGSLIIPVKALVLNLLALAAALGVLTMVFGSLDMTTPVLLFVFIFGLSMDYEVFLLARITEEYRSGRDNERAILAGITGTGPVVTAAAACLVVVFLGFLLGELAPVREIGLGMAVALILDVTIVRGLLLPSVMKLLGGWNWWPSSRSVGGHDPR